MTVLSPKNPNQSLNPLFNTFVTNCIHTLQRGITDKEKEFIKLAYRINTISGIPFSYVDFLHIVNDVYFRQIIHNLKPIIIMKHKGRPSYYCLKGIYLDEKLTEEYTVLPVEQRLFATFDILLSTIKHQPPAIHDIRIKTTTCELYEELIRLGHKPNKQNKIITLSLGDLTPFIDTKVSVHSTGTLVVILGCTYHPIPYSSKGFTTLISHLGSVRTFLELTCNRIFQVEPIMNWKFKLFDFNKDSLRYDFPSNDYSVHAVFDHIQVYNKKMLDGSTVIRAEKQIVPNTTICEEVDKIEFRRASELMEF